MKQTVLVLVLLAAVAACSGGQATSTTTTLPDPPPTTGPPSTTLPPATTTPTTTTTTVPTRPRPDPAPPDPSTAIPDGETGVAVIARGGAYLAGEPGGGPLVRAHEGLVVPVLGRDGDWLQVLTTCEDAAWVAGSEVLFVPAAAPAPPGPGFDFSQAVIVLDPGHGGPNIGAVGPAGLVEKEIDLDIARRARDLLEAGRDVDWATGAVQAGDEIPPAGRVWVTRTEGPAGADIEAGLRFRATLANAAGADAFVSIHNNAEPDGPFAGPGSEVFYRFTDPASKRLAGILVEELRRSLSAFEADWMGDTDAGAKYRLRADEISDYYGVLYRARVPAVLAEGAFISNPTEEALLATPGFRQAYAEAIYRALVRFLTTDDAGSGFTDPYPRTTPAGSGDPQPACTVPAQP